MRDCKVVINTGRGAGHFMQDATLFKDASYLNDKGARMFTEKVICKILTNE